MPMGNCGQRESEHRRNCMVGDSWFLSVKTAEASMNVAMSGLTLPKHHTVCSQRKSQRKSENMARWNEFSLGSYYF